MCVRNLRALPLIVNPAPAQPWVADVASLAAYVTHNEHELEAIGSLPDGVVVVETRGPEGVIIRRGDQQTRVEAPKVEAVDTTGAGDCFNGVFAAGLAEGMDVTDAAERGTAAAALSVTKVGAREGMPTRQALDSFLRDR